MVRMPISPPAFTSVESESPTIAMREKFEAQPCARSSSTPGFMMYSAPLFPPLPVQKVLPTDVGYVVTCKNRWNAPLAGPMSVTPSYAGSGLTLACGSGAADRYEAPLLISVVALFNRE
eukprot:TRINITY_DN5585_c0_g1_i2.p1 TRINITY_DN5585_c0_g1~~TRINITY_DN5585_c0_g1_i2.p1  ORF type:complete len:119 (-),score=3.91 TRINITY_DN5585_c0_g1_i2:429-785(-)